MFSVGLLYSTRDFLRLLHEIGITADEFKAHFQSFHYADPQKILDISFRCGWTKITPDGVIQLLDRGVKISELDYQSSLLLQLEDLILNLNPVWGSVLSKGRTEAKNFFPPDVLQCFKEGGLFDSLTDEIIQYWDRLALAYRNHSQERMTEIGRNGEKLSFDFEHERTGMVPIWQSVESNLAGFDLLSIISNSNPQKLMIEVKTSTAKVNYAKLHLTRNEWETANTSLNFIFHLWHLSDRPKLYEVSMERVSHHIPQDNNSGKWESVEIPFITLIENLIPSVN